MKKMTWLVLGGLLLGLGCGRESVGDKARRASNKAGQVVGESAGSFFSGVGEGVDKTITNYDVRLSDELKALGVSVTIAKRTAGPGADPLKGDGLSFYLLNRDAVSGTLRLRLFDDQNREIGRAVTPVVFAADDARYVAFALEKDVPLSMTRYVMMDLKPE